MVKIFYLLPLVLLTSTALHAEVLRGLTLGNQLISFDSATPGTLTGSVTISGLTAGDSLVSIDQRPANGLLYGFALNGTSGRLYDINPTNGVAMPRSILNVSASGNFFDIDFNPTVDRLRIVSDTGQNLRVNVDTGVAIVDGALQFAAGGPNAGTPAQVVAAAYTNSVGNAATTSLFGLEASTNSLVLQSPPNDGTLTAVGSLSGILFRPAAFDISGISGVAYAVLNGFELSQVDLTTGATTSLGAIGAQASVIGLAAPTAVPEPSTAGLLLLAGCAGSLFRRRRRPTRV